MPGNTHADRVRQLVNAGIEYARAERIGVTRREVRASVKTFLATGRGTYDPNAFLLWYADPTGEAAVARAMRA